jgi:hypothetical protein
MRLAMPEPRAQRTLVKSPPELWAELSDLEALARHLGEFGEIRITRLEPETTVAWEGDRACGTVELEPAGWGTKVTITAELSAAEAPTVAIEALAAEPVAAEADAEVPRAGTEEETPEPVAAEPEPEPPAPEPVPSMPAPEPQQAASEPVPEPQRSPSHPTAEPQATPSDPAAEPRGGFFARLFGRRKGEQVAVEEPDPLTAAVEPEPVVVEAEPTAVMDPVAVEPEPAEPEPVAVEPVPEPELAPVAVGEPEREPVAPAAEALDGERAQAILTGVLDDLGSAHHRPFSRG